MSTKRIYGLYGDDDEMMHGVKAFMAKGIKITDVYTPFPVHGLPKALKLERTTISDAAYFYGVYGVAIASLMTWYIMNHDWPQDIGGKPAFDWAHNMPAFVVIMFELMVFCAAHLMAIHFLVINKLYPGAPPKNPDPRTTDDKFLIELVSDDVDTIKQMLIETGVEEITVKDA